MVERIEDYSLLGQRVYEAIKNAIIKSDLQPGEKVTETRLADMLGVSRTPVREALRTLHSEGYIILTPNSSFVINAFTEEDAIEILQVRGAIEGEAARLAAKIITPRQCKEMRTIFLKIKNVNAVIVNEKDAYTFHNVDVAFHQKIFEIAGNSHIIQIANSLGDRLYRVRTAISRHPDSVKVCHDHHLQIMQAIIDGEEELACRLSREHTEYIATKVIPQIRTE